MVRWVKVWLWVHVHCAMSEDALCVCVCMLFCEAACAHQPYTPMMSAPARTVPHTAPCLCARTADFVACHTVCLPFKAHGPHTPRCPLSSVPACALCGVASLRVGQRRDVPVSRGTGSVNSVHAGQSTDKNRICLTYPWFALLSFGLQDVTWFSTINPEFAECI